jgi:hypothetical protein
VKAKVLTATVVGRAEAAAHALTRVGEEAHGAFVTMTGKLRMLNARSPINTLSWIRESEVHCQS